ncbi:transposase [Paenibacillus sp. strain BS8-2]
MRSLWDRFDYSLLLTQSGIMKRNGVPYWILCFMYKMGLVSNCTSVNQMSHLAAKDALLSMMFKPYKLAQYTLSRFLTTPFAWVTFGLKRVERLQCDSDTMLREGDIINLDDTHVAHPYAKKLPFICWLFDSSSKVYSWCMNAVVIQAVLQNGLEYPLLYRYWRKSDDDSGLTKYELSQQLLLMLRESVKCRLWVAMDRWYLKKEFMTFLALHGYDWVTKAKRNTALYRKVSCSGRRDRYVPVSARQLIRERYPSLVSTGKKGLTAVSIPDVYMKLPYTAIGRKGQATKKFRFAPIAAITVIRSNEDEDGIVLLEENEESPAVYKGDYLIISNRHDVPVKALEVYGKRWRIEVFFRMASKISNLESAARLQKCISMLTWKCYSRLKSS